MLPSNALAAILPLVTEFERHGIGYYIGGSLAGSLYGRPRATLDADLVADIELKHVAPLVDALKSEYYIDAGMIREAIGRRSCFNLIHLATSFKVDVFVIKNRPYDREALKRIEQRTMQGENTSLHFFFASAEDILLAKLEWFRIGDEISERQWSDIAAIVRNQFERLDRSYLRHWATELGVADLLAKAWKEVEADGP